MTNSIASPLAVTRVRHPLKFRLLQVARVEALTPHLTRVTLTGKDLQDFASASFDDHVKVFFPEPGADRPALPLPPTEPDGRPVFPEGQRPVARDYTPRRFDPAANELVIDFVLHETGPATTWAAQAQPGQYLGVGGPRGSFVIPEGFDWHLLIGDEAALPAIARRLEELPAGARAVAVLEARDASARIPFDTRADARIVWCDHNPAANALLQAVRDVELPDGEGYVWAACESAAVRAIREHLTGERGIHKSRIRASSYWKRGAVAVHETLDD